MYKRFILTLLISCLPLLTQAQKIKDLETLSKIESAIDNSLVLTDSETGFQYVLMSKKNRVKIYEMRPNEAIRFLRSVVVNQFLNSKVCSYQIKNNTIKLVLFSYDKYYKEDIDLKTGKVIETKLDPEKDDKRYFQFSNQSLLTEIPLNFKTSEATIYKSYVLTEEHLNHKYLLLSTRSNIKIYEISEDNQAKFLHKINILDFNISVLREYMIKDNHITFLISIDRNFYYEDLDLNTGKIKETKLKIKKKNETLFKTHIYNEAFHIISYNRFTHNITNRTVQVDGTLVNQVYPCRDLNVKPLDIFTLPLSQKQTLQEFALANKNDKYDPLCSAEKKLSFANNHQIGYLVKSKDSVRIALLDLKSNKLFHDIISAQKPKKYSKSNFYFCDQNLFAIYTNRESILLEITDLKNKKLLKSFVFNNTSQFSDLFTKHNPDIYKNSYVSNFRDEEKFIRNANRHQPLLSVQKDEFGYIIRIGGKVFEKTRQDNTQGTQSRLQPNQNSTLNNNNGILISNKSKPFSKYVHEMWLDHNLSPIKEKPKQRAVEYISNYKKTHKPLKAHTKHKYKDTYLYGGFNEDNNTYILYEFKDSKTL